MPTGAPPPDLPPRRTTTPDTPRTVSVGEAAGRLGISRGYAYELARAGHLPGAIRLGRVVRVSIAVLDRVLRLDEASPRSGEEPGS